jgi:hypothetical protein
MLSMNMPAKRPVNQPNTPKGTVINQRKVFIAFYRSASAAARSAVPCMLLLGGVA